MPLWYLPRSLSRSAVCVSVAEGTALANGARQRGVGGPSDLVSTT